MLKCALDGNSIVIFDRMALNIAFTQITYLVLLFSKSSYSNFGRNTQGNEMKLHHLFRPPPPFSLIRLGRRGQRFFERSLFQKIEIS